VAEAGTIDFALARFEHLVETQRGHIVRVRGTWTTAEGRDLPHPTLLAEGEGEVMSVAPLPIPGQDPPRTDGETPWLATYSVPKRLFGAGGPPVCRLQPAPGLFVELPALEVPAHGADDRQPLTGRPPARAGGAVPAVASAAPAATPIALPETPGAATQAVKSVRELYLPAVRSHKRLVLGVIAVAILGSLLGLAVRSPDFEATARLLVTPLPREDEALQVLPDVRTGVDPAQTIETVVALVDTDQAAATTARRLGPPWTVKRVHEAVEVGPQGTSNVIEVVATADDDQLSARMANAFAGAAVEQRDRRLRRLADEALARARADLAGLAGQTGAEVEALQARIAELERVRANGDPTLDLLQQAAVPRDPQGLPPALIVLLTALAGIVLAVAAAALSDLLGPGRIDTEEDATGLYPLPILTRLPLLPRGRRTAGAPELREGLRTLQVQLELEEGRHRAVMVTSAASGDGKTTTALAFALELAASGRQVILVDLDLRKPDLARRLGLQPERGIEHLAAGRGALADTLVEVPNAPGLELLSPAGETDMGTLEEVARQLPDIVDGATALADYVVLDTPPVGEVSDALKFAASADDLLVVCRVGKTPKPSFESMRDLLNRVGLTPTGLVLVGGAATTGPTPAPGAEPQPVATGDFAP
jgi:Mrp family chromosome partitioning ATPase/capsular polysaccharide biosynthesis protein